MTQELLVKVGMADLVALADADGVLKTIGLGSCVGLTLYDTSSKIAGMAHIMLPSSSIAKEGQLNMAKYADKAIPELVKRMVRLGANVSRMEAKMAGGAKMFAFGENHDSMRIGTRNVESCKEQLAILNIPIKAEDTGGNYGRTIEFQCSNGILVIRSVQFGIKEI